MSGETDPSSSSSSLVWLWVSNSLIVSANRWIASSRDGDSCSPCPVVLLSTPLSAKKCSFGFFLAKTRFGFGVFDSLYYGKKPVDWIERLIIQFIKIHVKFHFDFKNCLFINSTKYWHFHYDPFFGNITPFGTLYPFGTTNILSPLLHVIILNHRSI